MKIRAGVEETTDELLIRFKDELGKKGLVVESIEQDKNEMIIDRWGPIDTPAYTRHVAKNLGIDVVQRR